MNNTTLSIHKELVILDGHCNSVLDTVGMSFARKGEAIGTGLGLLREFHRRGVRIFGLTYNRTGPIGRGLGAPGSGGLTSFGREVVAEAAKLGMVMDVSHLSEVSFRRLMDQCFLILNLLPRKVPTVHKVQ